MPNVRPAARDGKLTEIDALNGHFVKLGQAHGLAMPFNEAVVAFVKGVERTALTRRQHPQSADQAWYDEWEQKEAAEGRAGASSSSAVMRAAIAMPSAAESAVDEWPTPKVS